MAHFPLDLALAALDVLDALHPETQAPYEAPADLVRFAAAAGPQKFHDEFRRTLMVNGWKRGIGSRTKKNLCTTPWLAKYGELVQDQTQTIQALCNLTVTPVVDLGAGNDNDPIPADMVAQAEGQAPETDVEAPAENLAMPAKAKRKGTTNEG